VSDKRLRRVARDAVSTVQRGAFRHQEDTGTNGGDHAGGGDNPEAGGRNEGGEG
jgi:hypothetical protein